MKTIKLIAVFRLVFLVSFSFKLIAANPDWGATGHRTIGKIADDYLQR